MMYATSSQLDPEEPSRSLAKDRAPAVEPQAEAVARQSAGVESAPWYYSAVRRAEALAARLPALPAPADVDTAELVAESALELEAAATEERKKTLRADLLANDSLGG
jgi:hypothetical protein